MASTKYRSFRATSSTDAGALEELLALGTRQLPVVARGKEWVNGQSLKAIAELVGIDLGTVKHLPPAELARRIDLVLDGSARFFAQFPEAHLGDQLPGRPRSLCAARLAPLQRRRRLAGARAGHPAVGGLLQ